MMTYEEANSIISKDVSRKPGIGFLTGFDRDLFEAEIIAKKAFRQLSGVRCGYDSNGNPVCPICKSNLLIQDVKLNYCNNCGQHIHYEDHVDNKE